MVEGEAMKIDESSVRHQLEQAAREAGYEPEADDTDSDLESAVLERAA